MAGSNDFTGQNIQDTYQRVLQLSSSGQLADGTGSLVSLLETTSSFATNAVTASHALFAVSASHEVTFELSSSHAQTADTASFINSTTLDTFKTTGIRLGDGFIDGNITASGNISSSGTIIGSALTLSGLSNQGSEATAVVIDGSNIVGTRELGSNAFTSTTIGTMTNALTVDNATLQLDSGTTFDGSAAKTISVKDGGIDSDALAANIAVTELTASIVSASDTGSFGSLFLESGHIDIGTNNKYVFAPSSGTGKLVFDVGGSPQKIEATDNLKLESNDSVIELIGNVTASNNLQVEGNISASGFISGSEGHIGKVRFESTHIILNNLSALKAFDNTGTERLLAAMNNDESLLASLAHPTKVRGTNIFFGNSGVGAPATASVFSASGDLIGGGLNINGTTTFNDGNITNVGIIDVDQVRADASTATIITLGADAITNTIGGANVAEFTSTSIKLGTVANSMHVTASGNISASATSTGSFGSIAGVLSTTNQPNITTVGLLDSLTVDGNINANGNITGDGGTDVTGINDIFLDSVVHSGDTDTKMEFDSDKITFKAGNTSLLILTEASPDTIEFGAAISSPITASNNISASLTSKIQAGSGSFHILQGDTTQDAALDVEGSITASVGIKTANLVLTNLSNQGSEATAVVIDGSNIVGTRELGSNAFTSTTVGTTTNALTVDNATLQLNSGTTFDGSAARTISIKDGGVDSDALADNIAVTTLITTHITASGNISASAASILTIPEIQGSAVTGDQSGSLVLSGSLTLRANEAEPAVSASTLFVKATPTDNAPDTDLRFSNSGLTPAFAFFSTDGDGDDDANENPFGEGAGSVTSNLHNMTHTFDDGTNGVRAFVQITGTYKIQGTLLLESAGVTGGVITVRKDGSDVLAQASEVHSSVDIVERSYLCVTNVTSGSYIDVTYDSDSSTAIQVKAGSTLLVERLA